MQDINKRCLVSTAIALFMACLTITPIQAATIHDEATDGDLADFIEVSPWITPGTTLGTLAVGPSTVIGDYTGVVPRDSDVLTFEIPIGFQLDSIDLIYSVSSGDPGGGSYLAIQEGTELGTGIGTVSDNLSNALVDSSGDLLTIFAAGPAFGGLGLTTPLSAGSYTIGLHETSEADISYSLTFNVTPVPEPASIALVLLAGLASLAAPRRS